MITMIIIGCFVGLVLGLTGAGGALIAIPLFLNYLQASIGQATFLSLLVVLLSSGANYLFMKEKADKKLVLEIWIFSFIGAYLASLIKHAVSDLMIVFLLGSVSLYGLWKVWNESSFSESKKERKHSRQKSIVLGIFFGALTTLTGLGGGALIIPLLISQFQFSYQEALPSSLLLIFLVSLGSFGMQLITRGQSLSLMNVLSLTIGIILAIVLSRHLSKKIPAETLNRVRKVVFTLVVFYSLISLGVKIVT